MTLEETNEQASRLTVAAVPDLLSRRRSKPFVLVVPAVLVLFLLTIYPLLYMLWISLHEWPILPTLPRRFLGFDHFLFLLGSASFWRSVGVTTTFMFFSVAIQMVLGLSIALLLGTPHRSMKTIQLLFIIPVFISPVIVGLIWKLMLGYDLGIINYFFRTLGIGGVNWLGDPWLAVVSLVVVDTWQWTPFTVLILRSGLDSLPREPFEAAQIDGAGRIATFRHLTLPLLAPVLSVALLFRTLDAFKQFDIVYILTRGGPGDATNLLTYDIWFKGFFSNQLGLAAALSVLMMIIATILAYGLVTVMQRWERH